MVYMRLDSYMFPVGRQLPGRFGLVNLTPRACPTPEETTSTLLSGDTLECNICRRIQIIAVTLPNIRRYAAFFTFEPRGCYGADTALSSQRQWRFEDDRVQSRLRRHGVMSAAEVWKKKELCLKAVALLCVVADEEENEGEEGDLLVAAALSF